MRRLTLGFVLSLATISAVQARFVSVVGAAQEPSASLRPERAGGQAGGDVARLPVEVHGTVRLNGEPYRRRRILLGAPSHRSSGSAMTDENGRYSVRLPAPGQYLVFVGIAGMHGHVDLSEGSNRHDLDIEGGTVEVSVSGIATTARVELRREGFVSAQSIAPDTIHRWEGVRPGEYLVSLAGERERTSGASQIVRVVDSGSFITVRLSLPPHSSRVEVTDDSGRPLKEVAFPDLVTQPTESAEGGYRLDEVPPGTALRMVPGSGLAPTCRIVRRDEAMQVAVVRSVSATIAFRGFLEHELGTDLGFVYPVDGECPVPLRAFGVTSLSRSASGQISLRVENLPAGEFRLSVAGRTWTLTAAQDAVILVDR